RVVTIGLAALFQFIMETNNPYAAPSVDPLIPQVLTDAPQLATRGERFVGAFIDGIVNMLLVAAVLVVFYFLNVVGSFNEWGDLGFVLEVVMVASVFIMFVGINWSFISKSGQTLGKKVAKTR